MKFKNPIGKCDLFATPESLDALELYLAKFNGSERMAAVTAFGMTMNLCSAHIDGAIIEQQKAEDEEEAYKVAQQMKLDMLREGG